MGQWTLPEDRLAPFTIGEGATGVLCIHGFTGTPFEMRAHAVHLADHGFRATNVKLPGHAEDENVLDRTRWPDWYGEVVRAYEALRRECDHVLVSGMSMGGTLGLKLAAHYPVAGCALYAAPVYLDDPLIKWVPLLKYFRRIHPKGESDIVDSEARAVHPNCGGTPLACVESVTKLMRSTGADLSRISCPVLLIYSTNDHTVPYGNMQYVAERVSSSSVRKVTLTESGHVSTVDCERDTVRAETLTFYHQLLNDAPAPRDTTGAAHAHA